MPSVCEHYDTVLAEHYSRMFGDYEAKVAEQRALLERLGVGCQGFRKGWGVAIHGNSTGVTSSQQTGERRVQSCAEVWAVLCDKEPGANSSNSARVRLACGRSPAACPRALQPPGSCRAETTGRGPLPLNARGTKPRLHRPRPGRLSHDRHRDLARRRRHCSDAPEPPTAATRVGRGIALEIGAESLIKLAVPDLLEALPEGVAEDEPGVVPRHPG